MQFLELTGNLRFLNCKTDAVNKTVRKDNKTVRKDNKTVRKDNKTA